MTATVHMLCGPVGAGKTTYGRTLARERRAIVFTVDEWMRVLFMQDAPVPITLDWALPRVERCEAMIWAQCKQVLGLGGDVVAELGFFKRSQRDRFRGWVAATPGAVLAVHHLVVDREVRRDRVRRRNAGSDTLTVEVDDAMFEWSEGYYEPLADDELRGAVVIDG